MNLFATLRDQLIAALEALQKDGVLPSDGLKFDAVEITPTKDAAHGELATNAAMVLAKPAQMKPRDIAEKLVPLLLKIDGVTKAEIAGPGFINLSFAPSFWHRLIPAILNEGTHYGDSSVGAKKKVNVEYVSANPTGPMHIGHARGAVVGDVTARLLGKAGFDVCKEYYINDAGAQVDKLAESLYLRYREANGEAIGEIPEGLYPGEYLKDAGQALAKQQGKALMDAPREKWFPLVRAFGIEAMMAIIKHDLRDMGIEHHVFSSEKAIADAGLIDAAVKTLEGKGLAYMGTLEPPKGKAPEDWEPVELLLFKSTQFGDDSDRPLKKSSGAWTYIAPDIAYHFDKLKRGFKHMILVVGADHVGYVKRLKAAVAALSDNEADLDVKLCQLVHLYQNGEPFKMSKRAGTFITVREVLDAVGRDILRFIMLTRKNDMPLDFDIEKVKEQSKDNPVFYVQYAHARSHSLMRLAKDEVPEALALVEKGDVSVLSNLTHPAEIALLRQLADWPRMIEGAALAHEPHRVVFTLQELAASFHGLWALGNDDLSMRFIVKDAIETSAARLMLARTVATVIASGLEVVGVTPQQEMR